MFRKLKIMPPKSKRKKRKKHRKLLSQYFKIVFSIVTCFLLISAALVFGYYYVFWEEETTAVYASSAEQSTGVKPQGTVTVKETKEEIPNVFQPPLKTKFLIMGVDEGEMLTDVMIVGCFDRDTKKIDLISVPRDTYTKMPSDRVEALQREGFHPPSSGIMKMNSIHSYAGKQLGTEYLKKQIEDLMGIKIDFYAEVNLDAFKNIVDTVGGVDMEIPNGGFYYNDPFQNLTIRVPGGMQHLDGTLAEGVVRYRATYPRGDLQRIEVQQVFLKELLSQSLKKDNILKNAYNYMKMIMDYVKTDFGIEDIPKYVRYINDIKPENITTMTLPGTPETINGASYFLHDTKEVYRIVDEIFYQSY